MKLGGSGVEAAAALCSRLELEGTGAADAYRAYLTAGRSNLAAGWPIFIAENILQGAPNLPGFLASALRDWPLA